VLPPRLPIYFKYFSATESVPLSAARTYSAAKNLYEIMPASGYPGMPSACHVGFMNLVMAFISADESVFYHSALQVEFCGILVEFRLLWSFLSGPQRFK